MIDSNLILSILMSLTTFLLLADFTSKDNLFIESGVIGFIIAESVVLSRGLLMNLSLPFMGYYIIPRGDDAEIELRDIVFYSINNAFSCIRVEPRSNRIHVSLQDFSVDSTFGTLFDLGAFGGDWEQPLVEVSNCTFQNMEGRGGNVFLIEFQSTVVIRNCSFTNINAILDDYGNGNGGALMITTDNIDLSIQDSWFTSVIAGKQGGLMYVISGLGSMALVNCVFEETSSPSGGVIFFSSVDDKQSDFNITIDHAQFRGEYIQGSLFAISNANQFVMTDSPLLVSGIL